MQTKNRLIDQVILWVFAAIICLQSFVIAISLRTNPSDVLAEVRLMSKVMTESQQQIEMIHKELGRRGEWMHGVDAELQERTSDRLYRSQFLRWRGQLKQLNEGVEVPELD